MRDHVNRSMEGLTRAKLQRLTTELRKRLNSGEDSRDFFVRSLNSLINDKSNDHIFERLACLEECSKYFYFVADSASTFKALAKFHALAAKSGDQRLMRKALMFKGIAYVWAGDVYEAVVSYGQALRIARQLGGGFDEAVVLNNLGVALTFAGFFTDALRALTRSYDIGLSHPEWAHQASVAAVNIAQVHLRRGNYGLGIEHIRHALKVNRDYPPEQYNHHRVALETNYVQLAIGMGAMELADERLQLCRHYARRAGTSTARLIADLAEGLCEVDHGNARNGVSLLEASLKAIGAINEQWVDAHIFLIRGFERLGEPDTALSYVDALTKGLAQVSQNGMKALLDEDAFSRPTLRQDELPSLLLQRTRLQAAVARRQAASARREAIERLAMTAHLRDDSTGLHGHRVGRLSRLFAEHLRLKSEVIEQLEVAGRLHDLGKMAIPDQVLRSGSSPSLAERELLNAHARIGADLLAQSAIPELQCAEIVARHHHERWDGEGYPLKMKGKRIPVECRIVAIVDCFDAMTHGRPHVHPVKPGVALGEIQVQKGKQFDPELADAFVGFMQQVLADHPDVSGYLEQSARKSPLTEAMRELGDLLAAVSEEKRGRPSLGPPPPPARPHRAPSTRSPEPL